MKTRTRKILDEIVNTVQWMADDAVASGKLISGSTVNTDKIRAKLRHQLGLLVESLESKK